MGLTTETIEYIEHLVVEKHVENVYGICAILGYRGLHDFSDRTLRKSVIKEMDRIKKRHASKDS